MCKWLKKILMNVAHPYDEAIVPAIMDIPCDNIFVRKGRTAALPSKPGVRIDRPLLVAHRAPHEIIDIQSPNSPLELPLFLLESPQRAFPIDAARWCTCPKLCLVHELESKQ